MDNDRANGVRRAGRALLALGLILAGGAAPGRAQEAAAGAEARVRRALPEAAATRVLELAEQAGREGIPPGLITAKALEGAAKGVPPERILPALETYRERLRTARELVGPDRPPSTLRGAAEAVRRGVPPEVVRQFAARRRGDIAVPLFVLGELSEAGVPTSGALEMVDLALERGHHGDRLLGLSAQVRSRIRQGDTPTRALERVRRRIAERRLDRLRRDPGAAGRRNRRPLDAAPVPPGSRPPRTAGSGG